MLGAVLFVKPNVLSVALDWDLLEVRDENCVVPRVCFVNVIVGWESKTVVFDVMAGVKVTNGELVFEEEVKVINGVVAAWGGVDEVSNGVVMV